MIPVQFAAALAVAGLYVSAFARSDDLRELGKICVACGLAALIIKWVA
ncbi:hypothetical protein OV450_1419 [Actinobacteria bacterium OV450]|nr:hypothetical protein OV450_1419 [Actinobacteria bacterium OV450]